MVPLIWLRIYQTKMSITQECDVIMFSYFDMLQGIIKFINYIHFKKTGEVLCFIFKIEIFEISSILKNTLKLIFSHFKSNIESYLINN